MVKAKVTIWAETITMESAQIHNISKSFIGQQYFYNNVLMQFREIIACRLVNVCYRKNFSKLMHFLVQDLHQTLV